MARRLQRLQKIYTYIGEKIRLKRRALGLSQSELAKKSNLKRPSIVLIEKGKQRLPIDRLFLIAKALHIEINELLPNKTDIFSDDTNRDTNEFKVIVPEVEKNLMNTDKIEKFVKGFKKGKK